MSEETTKIDTSLLELFAAETKKNLAVLEKNLADIKAQRSSDNFTNALKAIQRVKGAAQIADLKVAESLAAAIKESLLAFKTKRFKSVALSSVSDGLAILKEVESINVNALPRFFVEKRKRVEALLDNINDAFSEESYQVPKGNKETKQPDAKNTTNPKDHTENKIQIKHGENFDASKIYDNNKELNESHNTIKNKLLNVKHKLNGLKLTEDEILGDAKKSPVYYFDTHLLFESIQEKIDGIINEIDKHIELLDSREERKQTKQNDRNTPNEPVAVPKPEKTKSLILEINGGEFSVPLSKIEKLITLKKDEIEVEKGAKYFLFNNIKTLLIDKSGITDNEGSAESNEQIFVTVLNSDGERYGLASDRFLKIL